MSIENEFTKVSLNLLPLDDIQTFLQIKGLISIDDLGITSPNQLALAETADRKTVHNANRLGNRVAADYALKVDSAAYNGRISTSRDEIANLRDELYQLKAELGRKKIITNYNDYAGFHETFNTDDILYENSEIGRNVLTINANATSFVVSQNTFNKLNVNDYIVLEVAGQQPNVVKITALNLASFTVTVNYSVTPVTLTKDQLIIKKSLGRYYNGSFAFIDHEAYKMGPEVMSILDDDTYKKSVDLSKVRTGIGYTFKINDDLTNSNKEGFFTSFRIKASRFGSPAALRAYLIYEDDIKNFKGIGADGFNHLLIGKSQPVHITAAERQQVLLEFVFLNDVEEYPIIKSDRRLCIILYPENGAIDNNNGYYIEYLYGKNGTLDDDLQKNNVLYQYAHNNSSAISTGNLIAPASGQPLLDLYYSYTVRKLDTESISPNREGLYTKKIRYDAPIKGSSVRLTMRINREGLFSSKSSGLISGNYIYTQSDKSDGTFYDMKALKGIGSRTDETVVVGLTPARTVNQSETFVTINKPIFLSEGDSIYRVGYKVFIRAANIVSGAVVGTPVYKELSLVSVMPDRIKRSEHISDRLVYEADLSTLTENRTFNDFELQVVWETNYADLTSNDVFRKDLHGAIQDLTFTIEQNF